MDQQELDSLGDRESMDYDVVVVGAGPAGLATAIRIKQLALEKGTDITVCVLEKGAEVGSHILSGAIMDPVALTELFPDWQAMGAPVTTAVTEERFLFLSKDKVSKTPEWMMPKALQNDGCYVISLAQLVRWLAAQAEELGIEIFPGFAATEVLYNNQSAVIGVATGDMGVGRDGKPTGAFQRGIALLARYTVFAEGTRGQLGKTLITRFNLDAGRDPQAYSIGLKEIWKVRPEVHRPGLVMHTAGWPLDRHTYGGSFMYHMADGKVAVGFTVGLNYSNPWLSPFQEFQRYKTHPAIRSFLEGGERLAYGARAMTGGGLQALPELVFPGGVLVGCEAGFLNGGRIKGIHAAIKSGMLAAEAVVPAVLSGRRHDALRDYPKAFQKSWLYRELHAVRNFKPWMEKKLKWATLMFGMDQVLFRGKAPWTLHRHVPDYIYLQPADQSKVKNYPKPDGKLTFDVPSSVYLSGTNHEEDQPVHLVLKDVDKPLSLNLPKFAGPEARYCPAGVFSYVPDGKGGMKLQVNAANCLHCKTCDIKDPGQNITWTAPQGGDGPNYPDM